MKQKDKERFWSNVVITESCWIWVGVKTSWGYGHFGLNYKNIRAHRLAYELTTRKIPNNMVLDHLCRNKLCVNPDHLEVVSVRENTLRGIGITSQNAKKTHCPKGHPLSGDNLQIYYNARRCRICNIIRCKNRRLKLKNAYM